MTKNYYVYIMASESGTLYTGMCNNLIRRVLEHKQKLVEGFSKKYNCEKLVYFETTGDAVVAIAREKQIKNWRREKKENLIKSMNPRWKDLYLDMVS
ncbi:MAG TPA: GIY-YIG nuclease family protein [Patescibacteria group bacterium]|nr:GIY-YIG nuclease family protein [Patescibacteria group bacterium]